MFSYLSLLHHQAVQLAHILDGQLKDLAKDVGREKALKDVAVVTAKDKEKVTAAASEKARVAAEKRFSELEVKLGVAEQKLAEAVSLNIAREGELADLKAALEAYENKWFNKEFADVENSAEPIILEAQKLGFEDWLPYRPWRSLRTPL